MSRESRGASARLASAARHARPGRTGLRRAVDHLAVHDHTLWVLAVCFFGATDSVTTWLGTVSTGVVEAGPLGAPIVSHYGVAGMVVVKVAVFVLCYASWRSCRGPERVGVPLALATMGVLVTVWNTLLLLFVVTAA